MPLAPDPAAAALARPAAGPSIRAVALASFVGTAIEWYDFFLYGIAAALVFGELFFPTFDPWTGTLAAFGTYTVGFIARPVGGMVIGHYGDRVGRKSMLVFTLVLMGLATSLIGMLPTYHQIGPAAALGLVVLRIAQGFGVGGEWGGAVLMAVEHAPAGRRGFYGSWPQLGVPAGLLLATAVFALAARLPHDAFMTWGWRVPFLLSFALVALGLVIRLRLAETPAFAQVKAEGREARRPLVEVIRTHPREILLAGGARIAENGAFYIYSVFVLAYATQHVGLARGTVFAGLLIGAAAELAAIPLFGAWSDRIGRRPVYLLGAGFTAAFAFPFFWLIETGSTPLIWVAMTLALAVSHAAMYAPQAAFFAELFGPRVRYSGASLGAQLASVVAGGLSPFIATALLRRYGVSAVALYIIAMALVTIVSVWLARETSGIETAAAETVPAHARAASSRLNG